MKNYLIFLVFFSLLLGTRGDPDNVADRKIASGVSFDNNPREAKRQTATTITEDEIANVDDPKQVFNGKFVNVTEENIRGRKIVSFEILRNSRNIARTEYPEKELSYSGMECLTCDGSGAKTTDDYCFTGDITKTQKCADYEQCFTELHPQYIKRGCTLPSSINRTFVCKCPLCNDKSSLDSTYYEYRTFSDWEYDNKRLEEPEAGIDLLCKVCETRGVNVVADKKCRLGKNADYMQCGHNELCFTNIDSQIDFVSRGCISKPAFNKLYFFCNESKCNNLEYPIPREKRAEQLTFRAVPLVKVSSSANNKNLGNNIILAVILFAL